MTQLPSTYAALVIRTDFSDDAAWARLQQELAVPRYIPGTTEELFTNLVFVDDRQFEGVNMEHLVAEHGHEEDDEFSGPTYLYLADRMSLTHPLHPLLAVNLYLDAGQHFRLAADAVAITDANLSIANLDFGDYEGAVDEEGIHRGF